MRSPSPRSPSPNPFTSQDALLHGQFTDWGTGGGSAGSSGGSSSGADSGPSSPAGGFSLPSSPSSCTYTLTLTPTHIHVQKVCPRPGKETQLLLPLSELAGCNCPRSPAPPLFVLYWYPMGRRRRGVAKRRQMRAYLAETRAEAEKWNTAVQCLLRGIDISVYSEFSKSLLPRRRRLLLLVNPFSGRGLAMQWCQTHILPMISEANISYNLIQTERQNHARELIREISLHEWDGVIIVSGDGLLHEVINGLMDRPDWEQAIKTPVGILPCGSGNALAGSINHYAGFDMCLREPLLINCCFLLCRGGVRPMDLVSVTTSSSSNQNGRPSPPRRLYSFLSVAWGFVSDVDIESERYRGLGSARFTLGTLVRLASLRSYKGRLSYLPPGGASSTPEVPSQAPHRPLSRSITEGLEGYCRMPIHRTCSDMGLSEQRSLQKGDREREREERNKERERRRARGRGRGRGRGVVRASSLAEDREREMEAEERMEGTSGSSAESNGRLDTNEEEEEDDSARNMTEEEGYDVDEGKEADEAMDSTCGFSMESSERPEPEGNENNCANEKGEDERWNGVDGARDLKDEYSADEGREEDEEEAYSDPDRRKAVRKNSAPPSQIATAFFSRPIGADPEQIETPASERQDEDVNGTFFHGEAFPVEPGRERSFTISSPFRRTRFSLSKPKTSADQNKNQKPNASKPRPLSLLHQSNSNSLPPKFPAHSISLSPSPPSSPTNTGANISSSSSFSFDLTHPGGLLKPRPQVTSPMSPPPQDDLLPPLDQPLPTRDWVTIEGDFVLVLAIYQSHLGADLFAAPHAKFDDGLIHLTFVRAGISRATLLRLFLAMERGTHLSLTSPYVSHVSARAFRLQPLSSRGTLTVDGELVPYGPLQAQIHPSMARVIVGDSGLKITRF